MKRHSPRFWIVFGLTIGGCLGTSMLGLIWYVFVPAAPFDEYTAAHGSLEVRAIARRERGIGLNAPGGIYAYEYRTAPEQEWQRITSFRFSSPEPIPRSQVRFISSDTAYFYQAFVFGVTTDGGKTWTIRGEPAKSFDMLHQWAFPQINDVTISDDGSGVMHVSPYAWQKLASDRLVTADFGKTWK